jgi:hypothetical protein
LLTPKCLNERFTNFERLDPALKSGQEVQRAHQREGEPVDPEEGKTKPAASAKKPEAHSALIDYFDGVFLSTPIFT